MVSVQPSTKSLKIASFLLCVVALAATLSAGLWPFSFRMANEAIWKPDTGGLYLGDHGMALSEEDFHGTPSTPEAGCSIELWIEPALSWDSSTILTFYDPRSKENFSVRQSGNDAVFSDYSVSKDTSKSVFLEHALLKGRKVLLTITSNSGDLRMYLNGIATKKSNLVSFRGSDFEGTLIVGNSPYSNLSFDGTFFGIALYDRALDAREVIQHFEEWERDRKSLASSPELPYSLYLFDEGKGTIIHNRGRQGPNVVIPHDYYILQPGFLVPFWREFRPNWDYVKDLAVNVAGFVPLGACFCALFAWQFGRQRSLLYTTIFGFCVSLAIEILQAYMPTRMSGTTDLITNTAGTALGSWIYLDSKSQTILRKWGITRECEKG